LSPTSTVAALNADPLTRVMGEPYGTTAWKAIVRSTIHSHRDRANARSAETNLLSNG